VDKPAGYEAVNLDDVSLEETEALADLYGWLASYSRIMSRAKRHRALGQVSSAMREEQAAQRIYDTLPEWARW
jgi:hypothetical protein